MVKNHRAAQMYLDMAMAAVVSAPFMGKSPDFLQFIYRIGGRHIDHGRRAGHRFTSPEDSAD
jgi:hypothetical protein